MSFRMQLIATVFCLGLAATPQVAVGQENPATPAPAASQPLQPEIATEPTVPQPAAPQSTIPQPETKPPETPDRSSTTLAPSEPSAPQPPAAPPLTAIPASRVAMNPPPGFTPSRSFSGFENRQLNTSIAITERPSTSYPTLARSLTDPILAQQNILLATKGRLERSDEYVYVQARQSTPTGTFARFFLLFRNADTAAFVSVNAPAEVFEKGSLTKQAIEAALASATITAARAPAPITATFTDTGPFKEIPGYAVTARLFTRTGSADALKSLAKSGGYLLLNVSPDSRQVENPLAFAGPLIRATPGVTGVAITQVGAGKAGPMNAVVHDAEARATRGGEPMFIRQWFLRNARGGWTRILLVVPATDARTVAQDIARVIASYTG